MSPSIPPLKTSCHCNAISLTTQAPPKLMNECQCSICRRYGAQWSYYPIDKKDHGVEVNGVPITEYHVREDGKFEVQAQYLVLPTRTYSWGDDSEWFVFCEKCGCIMFWYPKKSAAEGGNGQMGINARMVNDPMALRFVEKRITYGDAMTTKEGVYDENGPIRK